ncbi:MAG: glycosyltransferase [Puniceicoccales bacterium]|nr:glycosyltransferase [Puniceicoccales bacterium]
MARLRYFAAFCILAVLFFLRGLAFGTAVSICIPVYNVEPWLPAALDSACNQTLRDIEIICVDDGSTDGSLAILKSYAGKDPRIKVLENGKNRGTLYARVRAALASTGEYVLWLDPDDELFPDISEKTLAAAQRTGADIVFFNVEEIKKNETLSPARWLLNVPPTGVAKDAAEIFPLIKERRLVHILCARLWRGDLMRAAAHGQLDFASKNHITSNEDALLFHFTVRKAKSYMVLSDIGYRYYRTHGGITVRKDGAIQKKKRADSAIVGKVIAAGKGDELLKKIFIGRLR